MFLTARQLDRRQPAALPGSPATASPVRHPRRLFLAAAAALVAAVLCGAPEAMLKGWAVDLLLALDVRADMVWLLLLDSPDLWHVTVFAALSLGILAAVPVKPRLGVQAAVLLAVAFEFVQRFVPTRTANLEDVLLNIAGVGVGCLIYGLLASLVEKWKWLSG